MKVTLPEFERAGVLVVGDVMLDRYWYGPTSRISPEAPVPVVKVENIEERPGGAANVAMNIASLGATSRLVGLTGIDDAARALSQALANVNVKCDFVSVPTHPTITKLRVLSRNQQLIRLDFEEGFSGVDPQPMHERIQQALGSIGALVLSDYAKGALTSVQTMIKLAREAGVPVLIDPKGTDFERYRGATLLTPNLSEFEAVVGKCQDEAEIVERGMKLIAEFEPSALLVTRSEQGMTLLQPGRPPLHMPTQAQEVYDVTGAGDTVIGVLAATLASGNTLEEACYFANAAAGVVVGKLGTSTVSPVELENAVRGRAETGFGVMSEEELKQAVAAARKRGEKSGDDQRGLRHSACRPCLLSGECAQAGRPSDRGGQQRCLNQTSERRNPPGEPAGAADDRAGGAGGRRLGGLLRGRHPAAADCRYPAGPAGQRRRL